MNLFNENTTKILFGKLKSGSDYEFKYLIHKGPYNPIITPIIKGIIKANQKKYTYQNGYAVAIYYVGELVTVLAPEEFVESV